MNARIVLPVAVLTSIVSLSVCLPPTATAAGGSLPDNDAQARAREALYGEGPPVAAPAQVVPTQAPAEQTPAPVQTSEVTETAAPAAVVSHEGPQPDNEAQARARAALRAGEPEPAAVESTPPPVQAEPVVAGVAEEMPTAMETETRAIPAAAGMAAPALPTSQSQQQQLDALLQQYRADEISASEYHTRRADILAGK